MSGIKGFFASLLILYVVLKFSFVAYFIADKKMNALEAIKGSFYLTRSFIIKMKLVLAWIPLLVLMTFIVVTTFGLGTILIFPLIDLFFTAAYIKLNKD